MFDIMAAVWGIQCKTMRVDLGFDARLQPRLCMHVDLTLLRYRGIDGPDG